MIETKKTIVDEVEEMKVLLNTLSLEQRDVHAWNYKREFFKAHFTKAAISTLDASGYITKWLKGEV